MKIKTYVFVLFFCVASESSIADFFQGLETFPSWSIDAARQSAEHAIANKKLFLYSTGGFVCYPKAEHRYKDFIKLLPVKTLACGCIISNIGKEVAQWEYALVFNNIILEYVSKNPDEVKKMRKPYDDFSSYLNSTSRTNISAIPILKANK